MLFPTLPQNRWLCRTDVLKCCRLVLSFGLVSLVHVLLCIPYVSCTHCFFDTLKCFFDTLKCFFRLFHKIGGYAGLTYWSSGLRSSWYSWVAAHVQYTTCTGNACDSTWAAGQKKNYVLSRHSLLCIDAHTLLFLCIITCFFWVLHR